MEVLNSLLAWRFRSLFNRPDVVADRAVSELFEQLRPSARYTSTPKVVAMIGLVGSGKSWVARRIAENMGAAIVETEAIRVYMLTRGMVEVDDSGTLFRIRARLAYKLLTLGYSVVLDADHVGTDDQSFVTLLALCSRVPCFYVRTVCNLIVHVVRIQRFTNMSESLYRYFASRHEEIRNFMLPSAMRQHEMMRRIGFHYRFSARPDGRWVLRSFDHIPGLVTLQTDGTDWEEVLDRAMKEW